MLRDFQETVTGSTLNGRKEYLKADEGDKDKWEFLSLASAWTPSEMVLSLEGNTGNVNDDIFFSYVSFSESLTVKTSNFTFTTFPVGIFSCKNILTH